MQFVDVQGQKFQMEELNDTCMRLVNMGVATELKIQKLMNERAVLTRAKNAYIDDLKLEVVESKSGLDIGALFSDDYED